MIPKPKPRADIAIVTVIETELAAAKLAYGIKPTDKESRDVDGLRYWETTARGMDAGSELTIVVTMVGEARNVQMTNACHRLFNTYEVGACFLVGIAASLKDYVGLGDVVAAEDMVLDYEGQRLEPTGAKRRPKPYTLN